MTTPEHIPNDELAPLLNREYWDGHMLGDGQATPADPDTFLGPVLGPTARFASRALHDHLSAMHTYFPLKTYNLDTTFDPEEWAPGTVTLFDREVLRVIGQGTAPRLETDGVRQVLRPTDLQPHLDRHDVDGSTVIRDWERGVAYARMMHWGVVIATESGRRAMQRTSTLRTFKDEQTGMVRVGPMLPEPVPIRVGKTSHFIGRSEERLERVNILQVVSVGSEKRQKKRLFATGWLGRLATDS